MTPPPSSTYNSVNMFELFQNPNFSSNFFPEWHCQNLIEPTRFQKYFLGNQLNLMFSKNCGFNCKSMAAIKPWYFWKLWWWLLISINYRSKGFRSWKSWNIWTFFYWNPTPLNSFRLCNKWSSGPPVRQNKNKVLSLLNGGQYAQDRVGEKRKFSPLIFKWQGHLILKIEEEKKFSDIKICCI